MASSAMADISFSFNGSWTLDDGVQFTFTDVGINGSTDIVELAGFTLDSTDATNPYSFSPTTYTNGISIYDSTHNDLLFQADVELVSLITAGPSATNYPYFLVNISNAIIDQTTSYADDFGLMSHGIMSIALLNNATSTSFDSLIQGKMDSSGGILGNVSPVPEPGVTLLFGVGVAGFAGVIRRRKTITA
jgi:hypothetical protein